MYRAMWWRRLFETLFLAIIALTLIVHFTNNWVRGDGLAREGKPCGPADHWVYQRSNVTNSEYSCEPD